MMGRFVHLCNPAVAGPTTPSAVNPWVDWNARTAEAVFWPKNPSATSVAPFTIEDSSEARNRQQFAISSAVPGRLVGTFAVARS